MMQPLRYLLLVALLFSPALLMAQRADSAAPPPVDTTAWMGRGVGLYPKQDRNPLRKLNVSGFYRMFGTHRIMNGDYLVDAGAGPATMARRELFIADDAQLPNLLINIGGNPAPRTSFGMDLYMFQFLHGDIGQAYTGQVTEANRPSIFNPIVGTRLGPNLGVNLGINLTGGYQTDHGNFNVRMGGIYWYSMSQLTLASFQGYNRFSLFERAPWDPFSKGGQRYSQYYDTGAINQDLRWGEQAFTGVIFEGADLPQDLSFAFLYGKTQLNGGFTTIPNTSVGGQLRKNFNDGQFVGVNSFNSQTWSDSLNEEGIGFNVLTGEYLFKKNDYQFLGEIGMGRYFSPDSALAWGEAIQLRFRIPEKVIKTPMEIQLFRIHQNVINNNAVFWNSSVQEVSVGGTEITTGQVNDALRPFASSMVGVGQMTNNRQGLSINAGHDIKNLKIAVGWMASGELEAVSNIVTYGPVVNSLTRSRLWRWNFVSDVGPYDRYSVIYRGTYDKVLLTDDVRGVPVNPKRFNSLELQGKYKTRLGKRPLYLFYLGRYNSAQDQWAPLTVFTEDAYVRHYASEVEVYYQFHRNVVFTGYLGYERILGNYNTQVDAVTRRPRNMTGEGVGIGIDYTLGKNTGLFIRHRWFGFEDTSFTQDTFSGTETLVELKMFF